MDTAVKSDRARIASTTATKAVTGVALSKSVTCGYEELLEIVEGMSKGYIRTICMLSPSTRTAFWPTIF